MTDAKLKLSMDMLSQNIGKTRFTIWSAQMQQLSMDFLKLDQLQISTPGAKPQLIWLGPSSSPNTHPTYSNWRCLISILRMIFSCPTCSYGNRSIATTDVILTILIPMGDNFSNEFIPQLNHEFLTNLNGKAQLFMVVKLSDLMESSLINSIYLWNQHGVLDNYAGYSNIGIFSTALCHSFNLPYGSGKLS